MGKEAGVTKTGRKEKGGKWEKWSERDGDGENERMFTKRHI